MYTEMLTKNFSLQEMIESRTATKLDFKEQYEVSDEIIENLTLLCENVLQPLRDKLKGSIVITSGYRCKRLNAKVGGKPNSQHLVGKAADCTYINEKGIIDNSALYKALTQSDLEYDQCIDEMGGKWIHISYNKGKNRKQFFKLA